MDKKPGALGLLLTLGSKKPKTEQQPDEESPKQLAAQGLIDAVKDGDAMAVAEAFETLLSACKPAEPDEDDAA